MEQRFETFEVLDDHIKLLRRAYVRWEDCEYGAPAIDCKRPYGNSSVEHDIAEILGWDVDDHIGPEDMMRARELHTDTETVLQIVLATGEFAAGTYRKPVYSNKWERVS